MTSVLRPTTPEIAKAVDVFEAAIGSFLGLFAPSPDQVGKYEAELEAHKLLALAIRNLEAVFQIARADLVLLPSALVLSRSTFEISTRALWLMQPSDPMQREARWVAHLRDEVQYYERLVKRYEHVGADPAIPLHRRSQLHEFVESVAALLPAGCTPPSRIPKFDVMLEALGVPSAYPIYAILSQYTHGTHFATWLYRRNLGTKMLSGEFTAPHQWYVPLTASWWAFQAVSARLVEVVTGRPSEALSGAREVQEAIEAVRDTKTSGTRRPTTR
jgi:hypothetical protein